MQSNNPNRFIVVEGISGSGKTKISKMLAQQLHARYYATPSGLFRRVRQEADSTLSLEARFLFYLASITHASSEISQILEEQTVVCDKYVWSTVCYHRVYGLDVELPTIVPYIHPKHVFLLRCNEETRLQRLQRRERVDDNVQMYGLRQEIERRCFAEFQQRIPDVIDNSQEGPQDTVDRILGIIRRG